MFQTFYAGGVSLLIAVGTAVVIYIGALHVISGKLTTGGLIVFITVLPLLISPLIRSFRPMDWCKVAKAGFRRCLELNRDRLK